ncbi:MAG: cell division protein FtsZ [Endomicrobiales bacterium]|nr:cell division protein FtsZ [Endomicrobiales bacterium]
MIRFKVPQELGSKFAAKIKVVGIGGGGTNAINRMIDSGIRGVELIAMNTDTQSLLKSNAPIKLQIGEKLTKGLGVGGNPALGKQAAEESRERIKEMLADADMVFVTTGMGGGTGTGATPVVAQIAKELGKLIVAVVTKPFDFENKIRQEQAEEGIKELKKYVDTYLIIKNEKLFTITDEKMPMIEAFKMVDDVLSRAVQSISDIINIPGQINVDFADIKAIMTGAGEAVMGIGESSGQHGALDAARKAIRSQLLENGSISGAKGLIINITTNTSLNELSAVKDIVSYITNEADSEDVSIKFGIVEDSAMEGIKVTVIATGISPNKKLFGAKIGTKASIDFNRPAYTYWEIKNLK